MRVVPRRLFGRLTALLSALLIAGLVGAAPASADPAPTSLLTPPGANDWSCKPSAEHPYPVVLLHATFLNSSSWSALAPTLAQEGYCVYALNYGGSFVGGDLIGGLGPMAKSAEQISAFVDRVRTATSSEKVDIVGHSQGGMLPRYYMKFLGGADKVHSLVGVAPDNHGTTWGAIGWLIRFFPPATNLVCTSCTEQLRDSDFIKKLNEGGETLPGVHYTVIATKYDEFATPYTTAFLDGPDVKNITIQDVCPNNRVEHLGLPADPDAVHLVLNALDPEHATPVRCS
ncbi:lipase [Longimycelium tulufanense]|uniref:Lipase n=1 Tax=Longimycelium tulufanense TaxID=907463 RepID=A0A8J3CGL0_9PSEU|nr:alpha/beta fold hydrolase [Longimycelium tulufanense]GGM64414.1 lipase [Longimycelium tulufanense]